MRRPLPFLALLLWAWGGGQNVALAQPLLDPGFLEFTASADHAIVDANGAPLVSRYEFLLYTLGSSTPLRVVDLGKPTPNSSGTIRIALSTILVPLPAGGIEYEVRIAAIGASGSSTSTPSNSFAYQVPCSYSVTPTSRSMGSSGGSTTFAVTAPVGCAWSASSSAGWISISGGSSGSGNGTVTVSVGTNQATAQRSGSLTIAGQSVSVTQSGVSCTYTVAPTSRSFSSPGGSSTFSVTAPAGCTWAASTSAAWISITSGASGSGNGTVAFTTAANPTTSQRTASLTIAGRSVSVVQSGLTCTYSVSPVSRFVARAGGSTSFAVTASSGCTWSASEQSSWISIASGGSGTGNGTVTFSIAANSATSSRSTSATIAGQSVTISQPALGTPPAAPTGFRIVR